VENVAHAIAAVTTSEQAAGRIYNVCGEPSLTELAWQTRIAKQMNWPGKFVILPREQTPKHLLLPGNAAQHVVASSERIRTELGFACAVQECLQPKRLKPRDSEIEQLKHGEHEKRTGADPNWPDWYAEYIVREQSGEELPQ
jgi:hypothetical protein